MGVLRSFAQQCKSLRMPGKSQMTLFALRCNALLSFALKLFPTVEQTVKIRIGTTDSYSVAGTLTRTSSATAGESELCFGVYC